MINLITPFIQASCVKMLASRPRPCYTDGMAKKTQTPQKSAEPAGGGDPSPDSVPQADFDFVLGLIDAARTRAIASVNTTLIELYWGIGEYLSRRAAEAGWGKGTVEALAEAIRRKYPNLG